MTNHWSCAAIVITNTLLSYLPVSYERVAAGIQVSLSSLSLHHLNHNTAVIYFPTTLSLLPIFYYLLGLWRDTCPLLYVSSVGMEFKTQRPQGPLNGVASALITVSLGRAGCVCHPHYLPRPSQSRLLDCYIDREAGRDIIARASPSVSRLTFPLKEFYLQYKINGWRPEEAGCQLALSTRLPVGDRKLATVFLHPEISLSIAPFHWFHILFSCLSSFFPSVCSL